jgi:hypothetical protein
MADKVFRSRPMTLKTAPNSGSNATSRLSVTPESIWTSWLPTMRRFSLMGTVW